MICRCGDDFHGHSWPFVAGCGYDVVRPGALAATECCPNHRSWRLPIRPMGGAWRWGRNDLEWSLDSVGEPVGRV